MDFNWLIERLRRPSLLQKGDERKLRELIAAYPFFAAPYLLLGKSLKDQEHPAFDTLLPLISIHAYDRKLLFRLIHESKDAPIYQEVTPLVEERKPEPAPVAIQVAEPLEEVPVKGPLFEVNFEEVEKEEEQETVNRANVELPEIPFGWKPQEDVEEEEIIGHASASLSMTTEESSIVEEVVEEVAEENHASASLSMTTETIEDVQEDISGHTERSRSMTMEEFPVVNEEEVAEESSTIEEVVEAPTSRVDFFHWLDKLKEQPAEVEKAPLAPAVQEQLSIIDRFIETNPSVSRVKGEFYNAVDRARESERLDEELVTETLARIYASQEKYERAISAYEKLQLKYPQKSDYFAALIEELKNKIS